MKKLIFLPVVLAACAFAVLPSKAALETNATGNTSLTLNLSEMAKGVDNNSSVDDINAGLVTYGYRGGNPETGTYTNFVHTPGNPNDGDMTTDNCVVDWAGARFVITTDYIVAFLTANENLTLSVTGVPAGWVENSVTKYFIADSDFDFANPTALAAEYSFSPAGNSMAAGNLDKSYPLYEGETFMFAYGIKPEKSGCNLQNIVNVVFTMTSGITAATETYNIEDIYCKPGWTGSDMTSPLANYGVRFGSLSETNPYSVGYQATGNGKYTVDGVANVVEWWHIEITETHGFAFAITANERITVNAQFANVKNHADYAWIANTNISYVIVRNNAILKNAYTYDNFTDNLSTDLEHLNYNGLIELLPGDVLYIGFNLNTGVTGSKTRTLELKEYDNFKVTFTQVLASKKARTIVNEWMQLRNANSLDFCNLNSTDRTKLDSLIESYHALPQEQQTIVGRTIDVKDYTINEGIFYFENNISSVNNSLSSIISEDSSTYIVVALGGVAMMLVGLVVLKRKQLVK